MHANGHGQSPAIVVGVSPSTGSPSALQWAAREASMRGAPLRAVLAWRPARPPTSSAGRPPATLTLPAKDPAAAAEQRLRDYVKVAIGSDEQVECRAIKGGAVSSLLAAATEAQLLVLGEPRPGRVASLRASLIAPQVVLRARCPVVVLPPAGTVP